MTLKEEAYPWCISEKSTKAMGRTQRGPAGPKPEKQSIDRSGRSRGWEGHRPDSHEENRGCVDESLLPFVEECIEPGSVVHTDGWPAYSGLAKEGYVHQVTVVSRHKQSASELMRVHRVMSLLKRGCWAPIRAP